MTDRTVAEWARAYREELSAMDSVLLGGNRSRAWNRHVNEAQRAQLRLRQSPEGRAAITALIADPVSTVALWAATHALFWDERVARAHLAAVAASEGIAGLDARMTLREFDAGRLRTDWEPKRR